MLYGLKYITDHPVYRLHEAFGHFLDDGLKVAGFSAECFPKWFKPVFTASSGLRERCEAVHKESRKQKQAVRDSILLVWKSNCNVQTLCEDTMCKLEQWGFMAKKLIRALCDLFDFLYEQTLESKSFEKAAGKSLLDHYNSFRELGQRVCPFCGLNYYADRDGGVRSGYDHFLPRLHYPLAAVNFRNLVPMCDDCNERPRKGTKDVLFQDAGRTKRRQFYYPYSKPGGVTLTVKCAKRPKLPHTSGAWTVKAEAVKPAESVLVTAWDSVFEVQTRFSARVKEGLDGWMKDFLNTKEYVGSPTVARLRKDLAAKAAWLSKPEQLRTKTEAALQAAAFRYMALDAPDDMLAGYAGIATSLAVVGSPAALGNH